MADFDGDGQLDLVGMRGIASWGLEVLEMLVCLQTSEGYVVMKQARVPRHRLNHVEPLGRSR